MATRGRERSQDDGQARREDWFLLDKAIRELEHRGGNSLRANLTTTPAKSWDWSGEDARLVRVEEHRETGRRRIVIEEP